MPLTVWAKYLAVAAGSVNKMKISNDPTIWAATLTLKATKTRKVMDKVLVHNP